MLWKPLRDIVESFANVLVFVDALDECKEREDLLMNLEGMIETRIASLHMLVISRQERDTEESLSVLFDDEPKI